MVAAGDAEGKGSLGMTYRCFMWVSQEQQLSSEEILARYGVSTVAATAASKPFAASPGACHEIHQGDSLIRELIRWVEGDSLDSRFADFFGHLWNEGISAVFEFVPSPDLSKWVDLSITTGNVMSAEMHLTRQFGGEDVFPEVSLRIRSGLQRAPDVTIEQPAET